MAKVGLMDLGTLDALKKTSATNIKQTSASFQEPREPIAEKSKPKDLEKEDATHARHRITYPQPTNLFGC